ncbi:clavesin-2 [Ixodes scapularis]|uniref:clavesin-2 n=1 Tax=Ixodes scapularis TaxID=6945 RepID=UPI001AD7D595|nr:clavesin-2 [Ixodes scapularis]
MSDTSDMNSDEQCKSSGKKSNKDKKTQKKAEKQQLKEQQQRNSVAEDLADPIKEFMQPEEEENEELRNKAIQAFREWVLQQPHFVNPRTDDKFLLRFLRSRKYCMSSAQETFDRYLTVRTQHPTFFKCPDIMEESLRDLHAKGYFFPLFEKDSEGRTVVLGVAGALDPRIHKTIDIYRAFSMSFEALLEDEDNQKNGVTYILDESGFRISHLAHVNLRDVQKVMINGEKGWPMRHKNIHWVNVPRYISAIYDLALSMFSRKLQSRMFVHFEVSSLHEHIAPEILPKEFGGTIPVAVMADAWIKKLEELRDLLMSHDLMGVDESKRVKKDKKQGYGLMRLWNSITRLEVY